MSLSAFSVAWKTTDITAVEKLILLYIAEHAGMDVCDPAPTTLSEFCGCSLREVENALISLRQDGHILRRPSERRIGAGYYVVTE